MRRAILSAVGLLLAVPAALAASIGMSSAPGQLKATGTIAPFVPTPIYVVIEGPPSQVNGIEYGIAHTAQATVVGATYYPSTPICVVCPQWDDYISGFGQCYEFGPTWTFATISLMVFASVTDLEFCVQPGSNSSFEPPSPGLSTCDTGPMALQLGGGPYPAPGCLLLNPSGVANDESSWSTLKGRFAPRPD